MTSNWYDTFRNTLPSSTYVLPWGLKTKCHTHTRKQAYRAGPRRIVDFQKLVGEQVINSCLSCNSKFRYQIHKASHLSIFRTRWIQSPPSNHIYQSLLKLEVLSKPRFSEFSLLFLLLFLSIQTRIMHSLLIQPCVQSELLISSPFFLQLLYKFQQNYRNNSNNKVLHASRIYRIVLRVVFSN